jgi:ribonucleotide reductase alpha subunit
MSKTRIYNLETLQRRRTELSVLCKEKEKEIGTQLEYIGENLGSIALKTFIGTRGKKDNTAKAEIISLLVSEGLETVMDIQKDPHNIKDKMVDFVKNAATGVINLLVK